MANNQIQTAQQKAPQKMSFSQYINSPKGQSLISNVIRDKRKQDAFITSIVSAVSVNPSLQECTAPSIISAALQGAALGLAPSPQLGQFYMVPFKNKAKYDRDGNMTKPETVDAVFVPGYKGYIQLAYRSGQYADLDARTVVDGEYRGLDRITGRPVFEWIEDDTLREQMAVVGYMAYFELTNGAKKVLYWSREKMINHADRYSQAFSKEAVTEGRFKKVSYEDYLAGNYPKADEWKYSSFWYKDFDTMACKTMLRQLISKWGPVSLEMETAIMEDTRHEAEGVDYAPDLSGAALPPAPVMQAQQIPAEAEEEAQEENETPPVPEEPAAPSAPAEDAEEVNLDDL